MSVLPPIPERAAAEQRSLELKTEHPSWGAPTITRALADEKGPWGAPPQRTVSRWLKKWETLSAEERAAFGLVRWPESMGGALPWEAGPAVLGLLACYPEGQRPTVRYALTFWRVTLAAPALPVDCRRVLARFLEWAAIVGDAPAPLARAVDVRRIVEEALVRHARDGRMPGWLEAFAGDRFPGDWWQQVQGTQTQAEKGGDDGEA